MTPRRALLSLVVGLGTLLATCQPVQAQTPTTVPVTGRFVDGSGSPISGLILKFQLTNCATGQARIFGLQTVLNTSFPLQTDVNGNVSSTIWPNDVINCGGITGQSRWLVTQVYNNVPTSPQVCYNVLAAATLNLNTATPCPQYNPPTPPGVAKDATFNNVTVLGQFVFPGGSGTTSVLTTPPSSQYITQLAGTTFGSNSLANTLYADRYVPNGGDICQGISAAMTAANLRYIGSGIPYDGLNSVSSGAKIVVPRKTDGTVWTCTHTITPSGLSYIPLDIYVDAGAWIYYTGTGIAIDQQSLVNKHHIAWHNLQLIGTPVAAGGIRLGPGNGQHIYDPYIAGFTGTGAYGVKFEGTDIGGVHNGTVFNNYDSFLFDLALVGPAAGASPNGSTVEGVTMGGDFHRPFSGPHIGNNNRILNNTIDGPGTADPADTCGYFFGYNHLIVKGNYCEGITTGTPPIAFTGNVMAGSNTITSASTTAGMAVGQPVSSALSGGPVGVVASSTITAISGSTITISAPAVSTVTGAGLNAWPKTTYGWEFRSGSTAVFSENWAALTNAHAQVFADSTNVIVSGNATGGAEPAIVDTGANGATVVFVGPNPTPGAAIGLNPTGSHALKLGQGQNDQSNPGNGVSNTDLDIIDVDIFVGGIRMNQIVGPPRGLQMRCNAQSSTNQFLLQGGSYFDCSGVYHPAAGVTPLVGSCPTGQQPTYNQGIAVSGSCH